MPVRARQPFGVLTPVVRELLGVLRGRTVGLVPFGEVERHLELTQMRDRGIRQIPLAAITGSLGRTHDFDRAFLPRGDERRRRLRELRAVAEGVGFPPIEAYRVGEAYFVVDGHHRVALAREMGLDSIEAHVMEFPTEVAVAPGDDVADIVAKAGRRSFQRATGLDDATVDALRPTNPVGYDRLLDHIAGHRYYLGTRLGREPAWPEAVASWLTTVYEPVAAVVRRHDLLAGFPGRTESDLYLWLSRRLHRLREADGDPGLAPDEAVPRVSRWRRWLARLRR